MPRELLYDHRTNTVGRTHVGRARLSGERRLHPEALASTHHRGFRIRLCRAFRAKTRVKVESDVPYVREQLLRGHGFRARRGRARRVPGRQVERDDAILLFEPARYPVAYFPTVDIATGVLEPSDHESTHPDLGKTRWFNVGGGDGERAERGAWQHIEPPEQYAVAVFRPRLW